MRPVRTQLWRRGLVALVAVGAALHPTLASAQPRVACADLETHGDGAAIICAGRDVYVTIQRDGKVYERTVPWSDVEALTERLRTDLHDQRLTELAFLTELQSTLLQDVSEGVTIRKRMELASKVCLAAAGATLLTTFAFAFAAKSKSEKSEPFCIRNSCDPEGQDYRHGALQDASMANYFGAATALLGVLGGVGLYVFDPGEVSGQSRMDAQSKPPSRPFGAVVQFAAAW